MQILMFAVQTDGWSDLEAKWFGTRICLFFKQKEQDIFYPAL
jgi:hypothetical protein